MKFIQRLIFVFILIFISANLFAANIITSIYPVYDIVKNLIPKTYQINYIINPGLNPHVYEPSPKKVILIKNAKLFIGISKEFDGWVEKFLSKNCSKIYLINKKGRNPHIWLSPRIILKDIDKIAAKLCKVYPQDSAIIRKNVLKYKKKLNDRYCFLKKIAKKIKHKDFVQLHPAWNYFAKDFGFNIVGTLAKEHGANISLKKYIHLVNNCKKRDIKFIITGFKYYNNILENFKKSINGKIIYLDLFGNPSVNYLDLLKKNVYSILNAE